MQIGGKNEQKVTNGFNMRYIAYGMAACSSNEKTTTESKPKQEEKVQENRKFKPFKSSKKIVM